MQIDTLADWPRIKGIDSVAVEQRDLLRIPVDFGDGDGTTRSLFVLRG